MKKILLHSATVDNLDQYQDAGSELTVSDASEAGHITADRATELIDARRAIDAAKAKDEGDEVDKLNATEVRALAIKEEVNIDGLTRMGDIADAIRAHRLARQGTDLADTIQSPQLDPLGEEEA